MYFASLIEYARLPPRFEPLARRVRVDRDLNRRARVRQPAQLVVHDPQRSVGEHVDAIGLAADLDRARLQAAEQRKHERPLQLDLEETPDDLAALVGFHLEHALGDAWRDE